MERESLSSSDMNMVTDPLLGNPSSKPKGGLKTLPFIIANEAFEKAASYGLTPNMILYLMGGYGMELATGTIFLNMFNSANSITPVIGAVLADSYVGRFSIIAFGSIFSLLGMVLLWLTTIIPGAKPCDDSGSECTSMNIFQVILLVSPFILMSIGAGGIRSASGAFGADQLINQDNIGKAGMLERFFNWYNFASAGSILLALTLLVYIQERFGWEIGFGVPVVLMLLSAVSFYLAAPFYIKLRPKSGFLLRFVQVLVASWKKRHLRLSSGVDYMYHHKKGSRLITPSESVRCLNKACIVENALEELSQEDGTPLDPWSLCTVDQVEELKSLVKMIPIWSTGIMMSVTITQTGFPTLQAKSMNRHITSDFEIPAGSFGMFTIASIIVWIILYDRIIIPLASKITKKPIQLNVKERMGFGLLLSVFSMGSLAVVEGVRRKIAIDQGFVDNPNAKVNMSALWLLPHNFFCGVSQGVYIIGQTEFFYSEAPKSMSSTATNLNGVSGFVASLVASLIVSSIDYATSRGGEESWVSSNINKAHFDYYYYILAGLCLMNFFYYCMCSKAYCPSEKHEEVWVDED